MKTPHFNAKSAKEKKKNSVKNDFDFSTLLTPYCSEEEIIKFKEHLYDHPVSSLIVNEKVLPLSDSFYQKDFLRKSEKDSLLFRFDKAEEQLGKSIEHFSGAFYLLDPSSAYLSRMVEKFLPEKFFAIDLCAAPGGKTIAMDLRRRDGLYLANDIAYDRALEIVKNTDRLGLSNILTLSIDPMKLKLPSLFDLVILDAPCSGSGMIRKETKMAEDWSQEKVNRLLPIQESLLEKAYELCAKDGYILYSTCSLSVEEDENQIKAFLKRYKDMAQVKCKPEEGIVKGAGSMGYHLIPGIYDGEGIYFALLKKKEGSKVIPQEIRYPNESPVSGLHAFDYRNNVYLVPHMVEEWKKLPFISPGTKLHDDSNHPKCEFDHAFSRIAENITQLELSEEQAKLYCSGNEVKVDATLPDGLCILCYRKMRLGFGKKVSDRVKCYLPKGLRANLI